MKAILIDKKGWEKEIDIPFKITSYTEMYTLGETHFKLDDIRDDVLILRETVENS